MPSHALLTFKYLKQPLLSYVPHVLVLDLSSSGCRRVPGTAYTLDTGSSCDLSGPGKPLLFGTERYSKVSSVAYHQLSRSQLRFSLLKTSKPS